ncbi:MAG: YdbC family protein [Peptococcaceae bacterium]
MSEISYEIVEQLGVLSTSSSGWTKELNKISWNGRAAKYDLRDWAPEHAKMGKGVTLSEEELQALRELLRQLG